MPSQWTGPGIKQTQRHSWDCCILQQSGLAFLLSRRPKGANAGTAGVLHPHDQAVGIVFPGKLFVGGGFDGSRAISCVEMYDPARNEWKVTGSMTSPRSNAGIVTVGGAIFAVGGFDGNDFLSTLEAYDPHSGEWSPCTRTPAGLP